ncbi:MAG: hypothetical protein ACTSYA_04115 [Candidatus Kariarchaeaceae archaeon]
MSEALNNYVETKRTLFEGKVVPKSIRDRWDQRIVAKGFLEKGVAGAVEYLAQESQEKIGESKCVQYARQAETAGNHAFSLPFWRKAFLRKNGFEPLITEKISFKDANGKEFTLSMEKIENEKNQAIKAEIKEKLKDLNEVRKEKISINPQIPLAKVGKKIRVLIANKLIKYEDEEQREIAKLSGTIHGTFIALSKDYSKVVIDGLLFFVDLFGENHPTYSEAVQSNFKDATRYYYKPILKMMIYKVLYLDQDYSQDEKESIVQAIKLTEFIRENYSIEAFSPKIIN